MRNKSSSNFLIILLAYANRYVYPVAIIWLAIVSGKEIMPLVMGIGMIVYGIYNLFGYIFRWIHFYCSYQNICHRKMTPDNIDWSIVEKKDAYGVPAIFCFLGIVMIIIYFFR